MTDDLDTHAADQAATVASLSPPSPFHDLSAYVALPRIAGMAVSSDGSRVVATVQTLDPKKAGYLTALWELDPEGEAPARRLTRGAGGESGAAFTPGGDLLFLAGRPGAAPGDEQDDEETPALWLLPREGGEARMVARRGGGFAGLQVAREAATVLVCSDTLPGVDGDDAEVRKARSEGKASAVLYEHYPVRFWDRDLGPGQPRLLTADLSDPGSLATQADPRLELRDISGPMVDGFDAVASDISSDGSTVVCTWTVREAAGSIRQTVAVIDLATGDRTVLADDGDRDFGEVAISPDGSQVALTWMIRTSPTTPPQVRLGVVPVGGGAITEIAADWELWPTGPRWTPDGARLVVAADENGRSPLYSVDVATGERTRLTADDGAYTGPQVTGDGQWVYALRSAIDAAPAPVRVPLTGGETQYLNAPVEALPVPGTLTEVETTAEDGSPLRAWLALPEGAGPESKAPLLLWIHGGPLSSWNAWTWRWNPWNATARGYAVLLPDPALSTGYGQRHIDRGWAQWGGAPYTDLMALTDAALQRPDLDPERIAAMGGSFGGYMANWVAGHTDRFAAIVTHASLWAFDQFGATTDFAAHWAQDMTPSIERENTPHLHLDAIVTPMLVIHGDKDYRVPVGEGLRLWYDLVRSNADEQGETMHKFLYFPDEGHWVLKPNNVRAWYSTVFAFLDHHVLGKPWVRPGELDRP